MHSVSFNYSEIHTAVCAFSDENGDVGMESEYEIQGFPSGFLSECTCI